MQVVLIGQLGSGRTTLFNRITQSEEKTWDYNCTATRNVTSKLSAYGQPKYNVLDTPGFDTKFKKTLHAAGIITALTECHVNRIIVTIKLERDHHLMLNNLQTAIRHVRPHNHLITIAVTHWDLLDQSEREKSERQLRYAFQKLNCSSVIFTSKAESGNETCQKILKEIVNSKAEQINITPEMLLQNYQIQKMDEENEINLCMLEGQLSQTLWSQNRSNKKAIEKKIKENSTTQNIALEVLSMKQQTQDFLEKFEKRENAFDGLEFKDILYVHERLKTEAQVYLTDLLTFTKKLRGDTEKYFNNIVGSDKIQCSFEMTQEWKDQVELCQQQYWQEIQEKIEEQKQNWKKL